MPRMRCCVQLCPVLPAPRLCANSVVTTWSMDTFNLVSSSPIARLGGASALRTESTFNKNDHHPCLDCASNDTELTMSGRACMGCIYDKAVFKNFVS